MGESHNIKPMLNAYPDSIGGSLKDIVSFLKKDELKDVFQSFYILPSVFNTDLDRGFSVVNYDLNETFASENDLEELRGLGMDLKLDFILNHASVLSEQFQDILKNGKGSKYVDFFIRWNEFWKGLGEMTEDGYIQPNQELIQDMFFRKPGLPILMVRMPDGEEVPYWNTFYQEVKYKELDPQDIMEVCQIQYHAANEIAKIVNVGIKAGAKLKEIKFLNFEKYKDSIIELLESKRRYLGQMDLNIKSPLVWDFYDDTLSKLSGYGASIVRLDAFAYAPKEPGLKNFLNDPDTWNVLGQVQELADKYKLTLLPEIHASYGEKIHEVLNDKGYMVYDFFLPGLIIDAFEEQNGSMLERWGNEIIEKKMDVVNMLGCHDGIPLLDLKGLIPEERIEALIDTVVARGGYVKNLHGQKNMYYQVNATYYSALGEEPRKMLLARAIQMFMPGKPQVWYLDLFAGKNDHKAVELAGAGGHKEINRTNLSLEDLITRIKEEVVMEQIRLLRLRNTNPIFDKDAEIDIISEDNELHITWMYNEKSITLKADLKNYSYEIVEV